MDALPHQESAFYQTWHLLIVFLKTIAKFEIIANSNSNSNSKCCKLIDPNSLQNAFRHHCCKSHKVHPTLALPQSFPTSINQSMGVLHGFPKSEKLYHTAPFSFPAPAPPQIIKNMILKFQNVQKYRYSKNGPQRSKHGKCECTHWAWKPLN